LSIASVKQPRSIMARILIVLNRLDIANSTVRALQFRDLFAEHGDAVSYVVREPQWLRWLQTHWPSRPWLQWVSNAAGSVATGWTERQIAREAGRCDVVYSISVPSWGLHQRLRQATATGGRLVMDLVDALWLPWFREFGWQHLEQMLAGADGVICENSFTAEFARRHSGQVYECPDSPQLHAFDAARASVAKPADEFRLGWIGGPDTADSLHRVHEALEHLSADHRELHLRVLGASRDRLPRFETVRCSVLPRYDQPTMVREALQMHAGIFPQARVTEQLHRGSLKAKIYMAAEAAAVCEDFGANRQLVHHEQNGLLVAPGQWQTQLAALLASPERARRLAAAGLAHVRRHFSREACFARLRAALLDR
jgi:glycosyltransferase involved in cell wall biosynthesis